MDKTRWIIVIAVVAVAAITVGYCFLQPQDKDDSIVGMYHISEYHQYAMDDGKLVSLNTGDGEYDTEFIEIVSCSNGIFEGYCSFPPKGQTESTHYPILGTYDSRTGMIQYTCSYNYPQTGLYDWLHGYIIDGVMQLSGITFGDDDDYYGSFEFTFIKEGYKAKTVTYEPMFKAGDSLSSFNVIRTVDSSEIPCKDTMSINVKEASNGLYRISLYDSGSDKTMDLLCASLTDKTIYAIGYADGKSMTFLITDIDDYIQINREYRNGSSCSTVTAYLTEDGKPVAIKESPKMTGTVYDGTYSAKKIAGDINTDKGTVTLSTLTSTLIGVKADDAMESHGNIIPYNEEYVIAMSESIKGSTGTTYYMGFVFVNESLDMIYYSGLSMSSDGSLNALVFEGQRA